MEISFYALIIWITAILIISLDIVIIIGNRNLSSRVFALLSFITAIWVISHGFLATTFSAETVNLLIRFQYILGISIAFGFFHFSTIYPHDRRSSNGSIALTFLSILTFSLILLFSNWLISGVTFIGGIGKWAWTLNALHWVYDLAFCGLWIIALKNLYSTYKLSSSSEMVNMRNMFYALFLGIIPPSVVNILLPAIGYFSLNWFGPISSAIWILIIAYSIIRYRQMNVRTVITEVLALGMTSVYFINIFVGTPLGITGYITTFIIFLILAAFLIRGVLRESAQKEELADLNLHLENRVREQTAEIRKAYEGEKQARRDLEKLNETKDQFIMITQHHLRTPVTSIRWELKNMRDGEYGQVGEQYTSAIERMSRANSRLIKIVEDFLSITAIKVGTPILNIEPASLEPLVQNVLQELKPEIDRRHIEVTLKDASTPSSWPKLPIDSDKMREVILIIIENAVRYNDDAGKIEIIGETSGNHFDLRIQNTGIGFSKDDINRVSDGLFYRGQIAKEKHPTGMGIGLSVARAMMKAHGGSLHIHSKGVGGGAEVVMRFVTK